MARPAPKTHKGGIAAVGALSSSGNVHDHHCTASIVDTFRAEYQLAPPKSIWAHAMAIAGGDFVGGGSYGLVVRWSDGEVSL